MGDTKHEFDVEIFSVGTWNGDKYTEADLDDMVASFAALKGTVKPPIKLGHNDKQPLTDGQPALGWITALKKVGDKLVATLSQVPDIIVKTIKAGRYKRVSSEIYWNYKQGEKTYRRVLAGLALLGADIPAVSNLKDLEAFLSQSMLDASFERVAAYDLDLDSSGTKILSRKEDPMPMEDNERKLFQDQLDALKKQFSEATALITSLTAQAAEGKTYKAQLEAIKKEQGEKDQADQQAAFKAFCEDLVKAGKLPPACRDILTDFGKCSYAEGSGYSVPLSRVQEALKTFSNVILKTGEDGKQGGDGGKNYTSASDELNQKAKAYMTDKGLKPEQFADAVKAVFAADADLAKRYTDETSGSQD